MGVSSQKSRILLKILQHSFNLLEKLVRCLGKNLILFPYNGGLCFQFWGKRPEAKITIAARIDKLVKTKGIP